MELEASLGSFEREEEDQGAASEGRTTSSSSTTMKDPTSTFQEGGSRRFPEGESRRTRLARQGLDEGVSLEEELDRIVPRALLVILRLPTLTTPTLLLPTPITTSSSSSTNPLLSLSPANNLSSTLTKSTLPLLLPLNKPSLSPPNLLSPTRTTPSLPIPLSKEDTTHLPPSILINSSSNTSSSNLLLFTTLKTLIRTNGRGGTLSQRLITRREFR